MVTPRAESQRIIKHYLAVLQKTFSARDKPEMLKEQRNGLKGLKTEEETCGILAGQKDVFNQISPCGTTRKRARSL